VRLAPAAAVCRAERCILVDHHQVPECGFCGQFFSGGGVGGQRVDLRAGLGPDSSRARRFVPSCCPAWTPVTEQTLSAWPVKKLTVYSPRSTPRGLFCCCRREGWAEVMSAWRPDRRAGGAMVVGMMLHSSKRRLEAGRRRRAYFPRRLENLSHFVRPIQCPPT